jgi:NTP pyrophosphatase (non-canonical NTP hydrolase)
MIVIPFETWKSFVNRVFVKSTADSSIVHLEREVDELKDELTKRPYDVEKLTEEYADCILCLLSSAAKAGLDHSVLSDAIRRKIFKNIDRQWRDNGDGTYSHIK